MSRKPSILAVDDIPANLLAVEAVLQRDYEVICAKSGQEALALLEKRSDIDVILLDIQMPVMDGYETARRIKQLAGCEEIPIVFITAIFTEDPHVKKGYEVGGVDYFTKPFDPDILRLKVGVYASFRQRAAVLKERERQIRESEEVLRAGRKLTTVLEDLPVGVIIADIKGRICQTNEELLRILNSTSAVVDGAYGEILRWWEHEGKALKDTHAPLARALERGEPTRHEFIRIKCPDGTTKNLLESTSPLRGREREIVGAVIVLQDITEHKKFEADFEQRITRLVSLGVELEGALMDQRRDTPPITPT